MSGFILSSIIDSSENTYSTDLFAHVKVKKKKKKKMDLY